MAKNYSSSEFVRGSGSLYYRLITQIESSQELCNSLKNRGLPSYEIYQREVDLCKSILSQGFDCGLWPDKGF